MKLEPLTREDMEQIRIWRHQFPETLRTPYMLTKEMQEDYYLNTICNRESHTRYWALWIDEPHVTHQGWTLAADAPSRFDVPTQTAFPTFAGYGGIENISWENRTGEISLLIDPGRHGEGLGTEAVALFLDQAFNYLNLNAVFAECYGCGPTGFWKKMYHRYGGQRAYLHCRKYYGGKSYGSEVTTFMRGEYEKHMRNSSEGNEQEIARQEH